MDDGSWSFLIDGRGWTEVDGGGTQTVLLMDGFGRRTIKNLKMWTEVDGWTDGRKFVPGGLSRIRYNSQMSSNASEH